MGLLGSYLALNARVEQDQLNELKFDYDPRVFFFWQIRYRNDKPLVTYLEILRRLSIQIYFASL
jgi:hypothetical protein